MNLHRGKNFAALPTLTQRNRSEEDAAENFAGPLAFTSILSLHIDRDRYFKDRHIVDNNMAILGANYPLTISGVRILTVTSQSDFHTLQYFQDFTSILNGKTDADLVYIPRLPINKKSVAKEVKSVKALQCSTIDTWFEQESRGSASVPRSTRTQHLFLECGTELTAATALIRSSPHFKRIALFGTDQTDNYSISDIFRQVCVGEVSTQSLCLYNMGTIVGNRWWKLDNLTTLDIHDCSGASHILRTVRDNTEKLLRLVVADSGYARKKPGKRSTPSQCQSRMDGKLLVDILRKNPSLAEICIYVGEIEKVKSDAVIGALPATLKSLVLVQTKGGLSHTDGLSKDQHQVQSLGVLWYNAVYGEVRYGV